MIGASYPIGTVGPDSIVELSESMFQKKWARNIGIDSETL